MYRRPILVLILAVLAVATNLGAYATEPADPAERDASRIETRNTGYGSSTPWISGLAESLRSELVVSSPGLVCENVTEGSLHKPTVIFVPGLLARVGSMDKVRSAVRARGYCTGVFQYSSHEGISGAANLLAKELAALKTKSPSVQIALVTHSMGGLVARACVEDPLLNPDNVTRLIMLAPPNQGSAVAGLSATEMAKLFDLPAGLVDAELKSADEAVGGFFGRAKEELRPGSEMLRVLNRRDRAAGIAYSIIAGTGGPIRADLIEASLMLGGFLFGDQPEKMASLDRIGQLARLDEWTSGRGDGVVSVKSAHLEGVDDVATYPFAHNAFGLDIAGPEESNGSEKQAIDAVINRLER